MEWKQLLEHIGVRKEVDRQFRMETLELKTLYKESFTGYSPVRRENLFGRNEESPGFRNNSKRDYPPEVVDLIGRSIFFLVL